MLKKLLTRSNIITAILAVLFIVVMLNPGAKALVIQGFMQVGLFQPPVKDEAAVAKAAGAAPNILFSLPDGTTLNLHDQAGKVVFINFWAPWCPPCIAEMGTVNDFYKQFKANAGVVILTVDVDGNFTKSVPFMKKRGYELPVFTLASNLPEGFLSNSIPTTMIINKKGQVVIRHEGAADYSERGFYDYIDKLIKE